MRTHVIQSWSDAAEYSGELVGSRLSSSKSLYLPNGKANTALFADEDAPKANKPKSAYAAISLPDRHFERMCELSEGLDRDYEDNKLSHEDYIYAKKLIEERKAKAWSRLCRARGWLEDDKEIYEEEKFNKEYSLKNSLKEDSTVDSIFLSLRDDNCFKRLYLVIKYIRGVFK